MTEVTTQTDLRVDHDPTGWDPASYVVPAEEGKLRFADLNLPRPVLHAIADLGFQYCTPIQQRVLKFTMAGHDAIGRAQTGTGKTAAFTLPLLQRMMKHENASTSPARHPVRALVLLPTRELADQVAEQVKLYAKYTNLRSTARACDSSPTLDRKRGDSGMKRYSTTMIAPVGRPSSHSTRQLNIGSSHAAAPAASR